MLHGDRRFNAANSSVHVFWICLSMSLSFRCACLPSSFLLTCAMHRVSFCNHFLSVVGRPLSFVARQTVFTGTLVKLPCSSDLIRGSQLFKQEGHAGPDSLT